MDEIPWSFHPYYRSPSAPPQGIPWHDAVAAKNGAHAVEAIKRKMERVGRENGIVFTFGSRIGSTRDAHRMVLRFGRQGEGEKVLIEEVFRSHFEGDADITSHGDLAGMAERAGVAGREEVLAFLGGSDGRGEVDKLVESARERGVRCVPTVEIGGRVIEGAEDVGTFYEALVAAKEGDGDGDGSEGGGQVCSME